MAVATFGNGCFWCTEAVFQQLKGVSTVAPGYSGGKTENPTYKEVCTGNTGHAEVIQITYDPQQVSFEKLLEVFWKSHDPTTLNRQGADIGPQYRSAIFTASREQDRAARAFIRRIQSSERFANRRIVTEVVAASEFYPAEEYHQDHHAKKGGACGGP